MHKFTEYISDLLFLHDCVIIPDFGGFICNYRSAHIDENSGLLCPPSKEVMFNRNLTHNDGLLANWIMCKEDISYEKALSRVALFSEELKIRLNQKQRVVFGEIGTFYADRRFNIIFEPTDSNYFAETFGMEPIVLPGFMPEKPRVEQKVPQQPAASRQMSAYIDEQSGNIVHRLLKYAAGAAVITGIVFLTQLDFFQLAPDMGGKLTERVSVWLPNFSDSQPTRKTALYKEVISPACDYVEYDPANDLRW